MLCTAGHLCSECGWHGGSAKSICANCSALLHSATTPMPPSSAVSGLYFPPHILWIEVDHQNILSDDWSVVVWNCDSISVSWKAKILASFSLMINCACSICSAPSARNSFVIIKAWASFDATVNVEWRNVIHQPVWILKWCNFLEHSKWNFSGLCRQYL